MAPRDEISTDTRERGDGGELEIQAIEYKVIKSGISRVWERSGKQFAA